jgi:hypothetical protein
VRNDRRFAVEARRSNSPFNVAMCVFVHELVSDTATGARSGKSFLPSWFQILASMVPLLPP